MDKNGDGRITADEIASALGESGLPVAGHNLEAIIAGDLPGHTCLTFNSFKVPHRLRLNSTIHRCEARWPPCSCADPQCPRHA